MVKCFHEAPLSVFNSVQDETDGDYALVHLFDENQEYFDKFKKAVDDGREVILDNSIFELGKSFDTDKYIDYILKLNPTWYIIPDVMGDSMENVKSLDKFISSKLFKSTYEFKSQSICVVHSSNREDFITEFIRIHDYDEVDMLAIPFLFPWVDYNDLDKLMETRISIINELNHYYEIGGLSKKVHLLGCTYPKEGLNYHNIDWIYSTDTSNPVMVALDGYQYHKDGIGFKPKTKLFTKIDYKVSLVDEHRILYNIRKFKEFWSSNNK